jgi:magnesium-transporting ATPase (P-type)
VKENCFFPADMVVLSSAEPEGMLYVETKNLDGETNLKLKRVAQDLIESFGEVRAYSRLSGSVINIEKPNNRIYSFNGNIHLEFKPNSSEVPLSNENVALRGMSLRNTEHVTGIIVYTGHDFK